MKPIWYLDVDGVINIVSPIKPVGVPEDCWRDIKVGILSIRYDQRVVDFINRVHVRDLAEIVWLTTWEGKAATELAPALGLPEFRVPSESLRTYREGPYDWWKWISVQHHAEEDYHDRRTVIWTDDDLAFAMKMGRTGQQIKAWSEMRVTLDLETLAISPRTHQGLTMQHLAEIDTKLAESVL